MGYVYFLDAIGQEIFKIGKAKKLPTRFGQIDTASPCDLNIWGIIKSSAYEKIEREIHTQFDAVRLRKRNGNKKEWFRITKNEAAAIIEKYNGFYTAEGNIDNAMKVGELKKIKRITPIEYFWTIIDKAFPVREPNIVFIGIAIVGFFVMQGLTPIFIKLDMSKIFSLFGMTYMLLTMSFCIYNKRLLKLGLIISSLWLSYLVFNSTYDNIYLLSKNRFITSLLSVGLFTLNPILFYRTLFYVSKFLDKSFAWEKA